MKDITKEQAAIFSALGDPTRLKLLKLLCHQKEPDALCVNALVGLLGVSQPAISQHLRVLRSAGLVNGERRGNHIHYTVDETIRKNYRSLISEVLIAGEQGEEDPCKGCDTADRGRGRRKSGRSEGI